MKILFADYETGLLAGRKHEEEVLKKNHPDWETVFFEYDDNQTEFYRVLEDADALVTAFLKIDDEVLNHAKNLKSSPLMPRATTQSILMPPKNTVSESAPCAIIALTTWQNLRFLWLVRSSKTSRPTIARSMNKKSGTTQNHPRKNACRNTFWAFSAWAESDKKRSGSHAD